MLPCKFSYIILFPGNAAAPDWFGKQQMLKLVDPFIMSFLFPSCCLPDHGGRQSDVGMTSFLVKAVVKFLLFYKTKIFCWVIY